MAAVVAQERVELSCVLIPLRRGLQLLLPSVCVAEVLPWRRIKPMPEAPSWCLGALGWRGELVPAIRFEDLNQPGGDAQAAGRCLVVMNRTQSSVGFPFYALAADGLPRMVQLADDDLGGAETPPGQAVASAVQLGTETAWIPDLGYVESQVGSLTG